MTTDAQMGEWRSNYAPMLRQLKALAAMTGLARGDASHLLLTTMKGRRYAMATNGQAILAVPMGGGSPDGPDATIDSETIKLAMKQQKARTSGAGSLRWGEGRGVLDMSARVPFAVGAAICAKLYAGIHAFLFDATPVDAMFRLHVSTLKAACKTLASLSDMASLVVGAPAPSAGVVQMGARQDGTAPVRFTGELVPVVDHAEGQGMVLFAPQLLLKALALWDDKDGEALVEVQLRTDGVKPIAIRGYDGSRALVMPMAVPAYVKKAGVEP